MKLSLIGKRRRKRPLAGCCWWIVAAAPLGMANAGRPLDEASFSLRFSAATSRFASYADVAAEGGAQAASEYSSSGNPASAAWPKPEAAPKFRTSFSPQTSVVGFGSGNRLYLTAEAMTIDAGKWGVFLPAIAQVTSNGEQQRDGLGFRFDAQYYQLQWGKLLAPQWAVGANLNVTTSTVRFQNGAARVARSRSESYDLRLGLVNQILPKLRVGVTADYACGPSRTRSLQFDPATFSVGHVRSSDHSHQGLLRAGLTWEYAEGCDLYADYQGGIFNDGTGTLYVHRFPLGIEQAIIKDILFLRAGITLDTRGNIALSGGFGVSVRENVSIDVAYQHDNLPEIRQEFGVSQTFALALAVGF